MIYLDFRIFSDELQHSVYRRLNEYKSKIEKSFNDRLAITTALEAFVTTHADLNLQIPEQRALFEKKFILFTQSLSKHVKGILSMQLAPGAIVTFVSNKARNQADIGHDLLLDDLRRDLVLKAINQKKITLTKPVTLLQGGEAIIARKPVFTSYNTFDVQRHIGVGRSLNSL